MIQLLLLLHPIVGAETYNAQTYPAPTTSSSAKTIDDSSYWDFISSYLPNHPVSPSDEGTWWQTLNEMLDSTEVFSSKLEEAEGAFPEDEFMDRWNHSRSTAISFSGGGSRSFTASVGYSAALHELGLLKDVGYAGGISGGSWFLSSFSYRDSSVDLDEYLGAVVDPEDCTLETLEAMSKECMRSFPSRHFAWDAVTALLSGNDVRGVGRMGCTRLT